MAFVDEKARQTYLSVSPATENIEAVYYKDGFTIGYECEAGNMYDVKDGTLFISCLEVDLFKVVDNGE